MASSTHNSLSNLARALSEQAGIPLELAQQRVLAAARKAMAAVAPERMTGGAPREAAPPPGVGDYVPALSRPGARSAVVPGSSEHLAALVREVRERVGTDPRPTAMADKPPKGPSLADAARMLADKTGRSIEECQAEVLTGAAKARKANRAPRRG
jgi:hypothetical protein